MILTLSILLTIIFNTLSVIHFIWAFGVKWGFENTLPTNASGKRILNPNKVDCAIVGFGLFCFGLFYFLKSGFLNFTIQIWIATILSWVIPSIFIIRAIGDFKYLGFFKKINDTEFGKADTKIYSPLCFLIGAIGIFLELMT